MAALEKKEKGDLMNNKKAATFTMNDICYLLGITKNQASTLIRAGEFPVLIHRGVVRIPVDAFNDWYEYQRMGGAA